MSEFTPQSPIRRANVRRGDVPMPRRGRDPFVARVGALVLVGLLGIPVVAALNRDGGASVEAQPTGGAAALLATSGGEGSIALVDPAEATTTLAAEPAATSAAQSGVAVVDRATSAAPITQATAAAPAAPAATTAASAAAVQPADAAPPAAAATEAPTTTEPACAGEYVVAEGDYWIGIADRAGISTSALLAANGANADTAIYPGRSICLPAGVSAPGPPPAPTTTAAPATTARPTTTATAAPTTTAKPTTTSTAAPTTTAAPKAYTADEVVAILRSVFPAELADDAIAIATRESNLKPGVRNWCCYGLFQIKWDSHQNWLAGMGITSPEQLYDPLLNAQAALMLYVRAGGWGPWGGAPG